MATNTQNLKVVIDAVDNTKKAFSSVNKNLGGVQKSLGNLKQSVANMQPAFKKMATAGSVAFGAISVAVGKTVKDATAFESIKVSFDDMTKNIGVSGDELVKKLQEASVGTINSTDLMLASNKAMALGVANNMGDFTELMEVARLKGRQMGLDTTQAFNDIVTGIGRGSPLILDNLGITIKLGQAQEEYAKSLGKATSELTENEKKEALRFAVMEEGRKQLKEAGELTLTYAEQQQQLKTSIQEMSIAIGRTFLPIVQQVIDKIKPVIDKVVEWVQANPKLARNVIMIAGAIAGLVAVLGFLGMALMPVITALTFLASPIGIIIALITVIVGLIIWWVANWEENVETIKWIWENFVDFLVSKWEAFKDWLLNIWNSIKEAFMFWVNLHIAIFQGMITGFKNAFNTFISFIKEALARIKQGFTDAVEAIKGVFKTGFDWIKEQVIDPMIGTIEKIKDAVNKIIGKARDLGKDVGARLGNIFGFGKRASGGNVTAGRPYIVGERRPEVFIPSTHGRIEPSVGGGGNIVVQITGNSFMGEDDMAEKVGDKIVTLLKRTQRI